jgi:putative Ca2+/H+ antiporter (TMEM165/GDT1 family)
MLQFSRSLSFFSLILLLCYLFVSADNFDRADSNGDGLLDRKEFGSFVTELAQHVGPFITPVTKIGRDGDGAAEGEAGGAAHIAAASAELTSSTIRGLLVILVTELGDKTFFIAAILAMRHSRAVVYAGAMLALGLMHTLSCLLGIALPSLLPRKYTHFASAVLFVYFGVRLLKEASEVQGDGPSEELQEAEEELCAKKGDKSTMDTVDDDDDEHGSGNGNGSGKDLEYAGGGSKGGDKSPRSDKGGDKGAAGGGGAAGTMSSLRHSLSFLISQLLVGENFKVFTQAFTLTFLAEWGDRSQIATIGLAASRNVWGILLGGLVGHAFCTGLAVVGGKLLAAKISPRTVGYAGGGLFLIFGLHAFFVE